MLNLYPAQIESISLHRVGNKSKNEAVFLSAEPFSLNDEMAGLLKEYFFKPFREKEENYYKFSQEVDLEFNEVYKAVSEIFENPSKTHPASKKITTHLFEQSNHPHIKSGEVYVVYFSDMVIDNEKTDAVGIFKSELKHDFLQFKEKEQNLEILIRQGININKLDKGCIVFNVDKEEGYKVLSVDSNRYDAKYWLENFLGLSPLTDENFYTKNYLKFCQNFAKDVVLPAEDKQQEVLFMNRAVNHFAKNDAFEETSFLNEVMENPELIPELIRRWKAGADNVYTVISRRHGESIFRRLAANLFLQCGNFFFHHRLTNDEFADDVDQFIKAIAVDLDRFFDVSFGRGLL